MKQRLPWLQSDRLIMAAIFRSRHSLELYDTSSPADVLKMHPFWTFESSKVSLTSLCEVIQPWTAVEGLYSDFTGQDLAEQYRQEFTANRFLSRWRPAPVNGWWVIEKNGCGVSLVRDFNCTKDRAVHAVQLSADGLAIYQHNLRYCSVLANRDRLFCVGIGQAGIDWLLEHFDTEAAVEVRLAMRFFRKTIFELSVAQEALPF